jgi:ribose-phosphate pyrophosphokinase
MRQDQVFAPGESLSARYFADLLGSAFDRLVTVDPHLHRFHSLQQVYTIPTSVVHAAPILAAWIARNIERPLVLGPDVESEQWVSEIAASAGAPHAVFRKERLGDREVRLVLPDLGRWRGLRPVLVDDIISSGTTILAASSALAEAGFERPVCLAVHALFDEATGLRLGEVTSEIASVDTIGHPTNRFAIAPSIAESLLGRQVAPNPPAPV